MTERRRCRKQHKTRWGGPACTGHKSAARGGDCCRNIPRRGQTVCGYHGGNAAQNVAAAERRKAEESARKIVAKWGALIQTTPTEAILNQVQVWAGLELFYRERAEALTDSQRLWGRTRTKTGGDDRGTTYEARPHAWMVLHEQASRNVVKFATEAVRAGIEERRVRLAESQGQLVADVIKAILADLNLTPEQQASVAEVVPRRLRLIVGGAA